MNGNIVAYELERAQQLAWASLAGSCKTLSLEYATLYIEGEPISKNVLYVMTADEYRRIGRQPQGTTLACVGLDRSEVDDGSCTDIIALKHGLTPARALLEVQRVFQRYNAWEESLIGILKRSGSLRALVKESASVFENILLVHDRNFRTVAFEPGDLNIVGKNYNPIVVGSSCYQETFDDDASANKPGVDPFASTAPEFWQTGGKPRSLALNLHMDDGDVLRIVVAANLSGHDARDIDYPLLLILGSFVKIARSPFKHNQGARRAEAISKTLEDMISGMPVDIARVDSLLDDLKWKSRSAFAFLSIRLLDISGKPQKVSWQPLAFLFASIKRYFSDSFAFQHDDLIYAVCALDMQDGEPFESMCRTAQYLAVENRLAIGVSLPFGSIHDLARANAEALNALKIGWKRHGAIAAYTFKDVRLDYLFDELSRNQDASSLVPEGLVNLMRYDAQHKSSLYESLRVFLENERNLSKSCKLLFVQKSSLQYRINKARKIVGLDLDDPDCRLLLVLAFKLIESSSKDSTGRFLKELLERVPLPDNC